MTTARASFESLHALMLADLDEVGGGFRWWRGHLDHPKVIFASDYLLSVTRQAALALTYAAWHEIEFNQAWVQRNDMATPA